MICSTLRVLFAQEGYSVNISHGGATTAAAEAEGLDEAGKTVSYDEMRPEVILSLQFHKQRRDI